MNNAKIKCNSCGLVFQISTELERNIKECLQCIEKRQDEMLGIMFGINPKVVDTVLGEEKADEEEKAGQ